MTKGVIQNSVEANKTLFTLKLPAQPQLGEEFIEPTEVQILVFSEGRAGYRGIKNSLDLLDVLYQRGVTDLSVLAVLLEATGHPLVASDRGLPDHRSSASEEWTPRAE